MKIQFVDYKNKEHDIVNCDVESAYKIAMKYLEENNKKTAPVVRFWTEDDGYTAVLDYGSHSEFVKFKGTTEEVKKIIGVK